MTHPQFGFRLAEKISSLLSDVAQVERDTHFEGRQLVFQVQPIRKKAS